MPGIAQSLGNPPKVIGNLDAAQRQLAETKDAMHQHDGRGDRHARSRSGVQASRIGSAHMSKA